MTLRLIVVVLFLSVLSAPGNAQQGIPVLSGEHDGFTRLVFQVDPTRRYRISSSPGSMRLIFPGQSLNFALEGLFRPLSRQRLRAVRQSISGSDTIVELTIACSCVSNSFAYLNRFIVLDIMDPPGASPPATKVEEPQPASTRRLAGNNGGNIYETARSQLNWLPQEKSPSQATETLRQPVAAARPDPPAGSRLHDVDQVRNVLLDQLTRAAEQGLIELRDDPPLAIDPPEPGSETDPQATGLFETGEPESIDETPGRAEKIDGTPPAHPTEPPGFTDVAELVDNRQISVITVFDRDDPPAANSALNGEVCPADAEFAVWDWMSDTPAYPQIAEARSELLGEFDLVDQAAVFRLARLYVALGFGREALSVMSAYGLPEKRARMLADLARTVDRLPPVAGGPLDLTAGCLGHPAIWRGAAFGIEGPLDATGRAALFAAFESLPINQRRLLGPRLTTALQAAGDASAATRISDLVARAPGNHGPEQALAAARLGVSVGADAADKEALASLAAKGRVTGPEALMLLVDTLIDSGNAVPPELFVDLELAHFQNRGSQVGGRLIASRVRALVASDAPDQALDLLARTRASADTLPENTGGLTATALQAYSPDTEFPGEYANRVLKHLPWLSSEAEADPARQAVARQYLRLGLPGLARRVLAPLLARADRASMIIAAQAHLEEERPERAIELLSDLGGADAAALMARAKAMAGDLAGALQALKGAEDTQSSSRRDYAWQAGNWAAAAGSRDADRNILAAYMRARSSIWAQRRQDAGDVAAAEQPSPTTLAAARTVLNGSSDLRDLVRRAVREGDRTLGE